MLIRDALKRDEESAARGAAWLDAQCKKQTPDAAEQMPAPITYRRMADIKAVPINWLWPGRIARGKVTMIAGDPGLGKSQVTISITAIVTTGGLWPVDRTQAERGNVIILSAEDDPADTIRPRLEAAGADIDNIYVIDAVMDDGDHPRPVRLGDDIARLAETIQRIGDVSMVIIDPVSAYLGGTDSHKNADVRALLAPLSDMAAAHGVAVVCVSHLNKSLGGNALSRVTGSLAFVAAARAAYIVTRDPDDESRRLFLPAKNNIGPDSTGLAYRIESATVGNIETCRIVWDGSPVTLTADDALMRLPDDERSERDEAADWLLDTLNEGPMQAKLILKAAKGAGIAERTLKRAKKDLSIESYKRDFDGTWSWRLKSEECQPPRHTVAPFEETGKNKDKRHPSRDEEGQECQAKQTGTDGTLEGGRLEL